MRGREEWLDRPGTAQGRKVPEAGRRLQRGSGKKARWEGRLRASGSKRVARSEGSWRPHQPGQEAPDQPAARPSALRPETRPIPRGGSFESHLVTWIQARAPAQGHRASRWRRIRTRSRATVTEPFPAGQNGVSPARRHPGGRTGLRTRGGGVGRGGVWEPVKESELSSSPAGSSLTRPRAGPGPAARLQVPEGRAAQAGRGPRGWGPG
uniref:Uncharacterized protein n=1 Tax=Rangifer tarandus platyrhynchus TaxID=3082113 RepID=A0ACB0F3Z7_RANTA|nr:unnamed protein product [Rangifer tarandus platyrhynchus]